MEKKKLLFVMTSLTAGGAERVAVNLINHLYKNKYDIFLLLLEDKRDFEKNISAPIKIICLDKKHRYDFIKLILKLSKIIKGYQPDTIISFLYYTNIVVILASLLFRNKFKILISERSYHRKYLSKTRLGLLKKWLIYFTYRRADTIIAVSKSIKSILEKDFRIEEEKIKAIYNPVPIQEIKVKSQQKLAHSFFQKRDSLIIVGAGRLEEEKRFDMLLKAFSLVRKEQDRVHLIILGEGELRKELENLALELSVDKFIDFVGFQLNPYAWIAKADVFVLSSEFEGFPNVILEAMACGTPVISTDCPSGPNEIITNGQNGILLPTEDEKALAEAIVRLLRNETLRRTLSEGGKRRAEDFRIEKILLEYEEVM